MTNPTLFLVSMWYLSPSDRAWNESRSFKVSPVNCRLSLLYPPADMSAEHSSAPRLVPVRRSMRGGPTGEGDGDGEGVGDGAAAGEGAGDTGVDEGGSEAGVESGGLTGCFGSAGAVQIQQTIIMTAERMMPTGFMVISSRSSVNGPVLIVLPAKESHGNSRTRQGIEPVVSGFLDSMREFLGRHILLCYYQHFAAPPL